MCVMADSINNPYEKKRVAADKYVVKRDNTFGMKDSQAESAKLQYSQQSATSSYYKGTTPQQISESRPFVLSDSTTTTNKISNTTNTPTFTNNFKNNSSFFDGNASSNMLALEADKKVSAYAKAKPFLVETDKQASFIDTKNASKSLYVGSESYAERTSSAMGGKNNLIAPNKRVLFVDEGSSASLTGLEGSEYVGNDPDKFEREKEALLIVYEEGKKGVNAINAEGYAGGAFDESSQATSQLVEKTKTGAAFVKDAPMSAYDKTSKLVNAPAQHRADKINKFIAKREKFEGKAEKLNKRADKLVEKANKAKNVENYKREAKLRKKAKKKRGAALKSGEKADKKVIKANKLQGKHSRFAGIRSFFTGDKKGLGKLLAAAGGVILSLLLVMMLVSAMASAITAAVSIFAAQQSQNKASVGQTEAYVARYLRDKGFSDAAIAGIMGNGAHEGGWDPARGEIDGTAIGLFQFDDGNKIGYQDHCAENNLEIYSTENQVEWMFNNESAPIISSWGYVGYWTGYYDDLIGVGGWDGTVYVEKEEMKAADDVVKATASFMMGYERCASGETSHFDERLESAWAYYAAILDGSIFNRADNDIVKRAYEEIGKPYVWGAVGPDSYDCSGFVSYCVSGKHTRLGSTNTFLGWEQVTDPQPGDIIVNKNHCGIYIGNGQMIHAPQEGETVKVSGYDWMGTYIFVRYSG